MNELNSGFMNQHETSAAVDTTQKATRNGCSKRRFSLPPAHTLSLTADEAERFLRIVAQCSRIERHYELFQLLQDGQIQHFLPHQVLISAWGDFGGPELKLDVISALPGVRTGLLEHCTIYGLLKDLYKRWVLHRHQPLLLDSSGCVEMAHSLCHDCALHKSLQGRWSLLVHGVVNARDGSDTLYVAFNNASIINGHNIEHFRPLASMLITQIDVAFRKIAALKFPGVQASQVLPASPSVLSAREQEILRWVSMGKTNSDVAELLAISPFTVKNHIQRILQKLNVFNRTGAVTKYRQMGLLPQTEQTTEEITQYRRTQAYA